MRTAQRELMRPSGVGRNRSCLPEPVATACARWATRTCRGARTGERAVPEEPSRRARGSTVEMFRTGRKEGSRRANYPIPTQRGSVLKDGCRGPYWVRARGENCLPRLTLPPGTCVREASSGMGRSMAVIRPRAQQNRLLPPFDEFVLELATRLDLRLPLLAVFDTASVPGNGFSPAHLFSTGWCTPPV